jgi:hypothetical protein
MTESDTRNPGYQQPVMIGSGTILRHPLRIEHADDKSKLTGTVPGNKALGAQWPPVVAIPPAWHSDLMTQQQDPGHPLARSERASRASQPNIRSAAM